MNLDLINECAERIRSVYSPEEVTITVFKSFVDALSSAEFKAMGFTEVQNLGNLLANLCELNQHCNPQKEE